MRGELKELMSKREVRVGNADQMVVPADPGEGLTFLLTVKVQLLGNDFEHSNCLLSTLPKVFADSNLESPTFISRLMFRKHHTGSSNMFANRNINKTYV